MDGVAKETNVVTIDKGGSTAPAVVASQSSAAILSIIDKLSLNPEIDITKIERFFDLFERLQASEAKRAYTEAFAAMQPLLPIIEKVGKSHTGNYAKWEHIHEMVMPVLGRHGFTLNFINTPPETKGNIRITAQLTHVGGHTETNDMEAAPDTSGQKNPIQAQASSRTYLKRYTGTELLNIASRGEDDDGIAARKECVTDEQAETLTNLITASKSDIHRFLVAFKSESMSDIKAKDFARATAMLSKKTCNTKGPENENR